MNSPDDHKANRHDPLAQAIAALKQEASASNLPQRTITDTLAALRKAQAKPSSRIWNRVIAMTMTQKIAAAIALTIGALTLYFCLSLFSGFSSISYAQVAAQIRNAKSMSFKIIAQAPNSDKTVTLESLWQEPGHFRTQMGPGMSMIEDASTGHCIILNDKDKTATLMDINAPTTAQRHPASENYIEYFKKLADGQGKPAGTETINGVKAEKFNVKIADFDATLYADAKTGSPVKIDFGNVMGANHLEMTINFDVKLDPALFNLEPPTGYKVETETLQLNTDLAENVVPVLKAYAQRSDGKFPKDLHNWADIIKKLMPATATTLPAETTDIMTNVGAITGLLSGYQKGKTYDYLPESSKLGDASKIVFWYQLKDSQTYKAIYGDLHTAEVTADKLPAPPAK